MLYVEPSEFGFLAHLTFDKCCLQVFPQNPCWIELELYNSIVGLFVFVLAWALFSTKG